VNRFHVHVHVIDLDANIRFYSQLFGAKPTVVKPDYAKWMLDDPRVNFAISNPHDGKRPGVAHLGIQTESEQALAVIGDRLKAADAVTLAETGVTCCYAQSDKYWAEDPQGLAWETFHTHGEATSYYAPANNAAAAATACCAPTSSASKPAAREATTCCAPSAQCC